MSFTQIHGAHGITDSILVLKFCALFAQGFAQGTPSQSSDVQMFNTQRYPDSSMMFDNLNQWHLPILDSLQKLKDRITPHVTNFFRL